MNSIRVLSKPTYSVTLFILLVGTLAFFSIAIPSLIQLYDEGKLWDGLGVVMSAMAVVVPLAALIYQIKVDSSEASLKQTSSNLEQAGSHLIQNIIVLNLNSQEEAFKLGNIPLPENRLRASDLSDEEIQKMIPPELGSMAGLLLVEAREVVEIIDIRRSIAKHLEDVSESLKFLAVEAADETLANLSTDRLRRLGLQELNARGELYGDIYLYLRGWLKSSIEFDTPMPEDRIVQTNLDRKLYLDSLTLIRDQKIEQLGLTDERQLNIIRRYLNILISKLDA